MKSDGWGELVEHELDPRFGELSAACVDAFVAYGEWVATGEGTKEDEFFDDALSRLERSCRELRAFLRPLLEKRWARERLSVVDGEQGEV